MIKPFAVLDVETLGLSARPESFVFGCIYSENFKKVFHDRKEMVNFLLSRENPFKNIFAHNAEFDYTCLFDNILQNLDNSALFVGSTFVKAKSCGVNFYNSLPILKASVEQLGKASGKHKLVLDDKFKTAKKGDKIEVNEKDIEYCYMDCEIVYDYLMQMFEKTGKIKPTVASCAMEIFLKNYLQRKFIPNRFNDIFRNSYYGGRVECFRFGNINPCYKYDVNSLYPFVCCNMFFPDFNKLRKQKKMSIQQFLFELKNKEGCAEIEVEHKKNFVGVLPLRTKTEIIYPVGTFTAYWNFNEFRNAYETGLIKIKRVLNVFSAPRMEFKELGEYMKTYFKAKNETEGAEKLLNKFLLNALTGKFAQKEHGEKHYFRSIEEYMNTELAYTKFKKQIHHFSEEREDIFVEVFKDGIMKKTKSRWNIPGISSYITSQARIHMLNFYLMYQDNLCYTDTDSLVLTCPLDSKYIDNEKLGFFKKESDERINIVGNKRYHSFIKRKKFSYIKGVSKKYRVDYKGRYVFKKMIRTKEAINRNLNTGEFIEVKKQLTDSYTKRKILKNGKTESNFIGL